MVCITDAELVEFFAVKISQLCRKLLARCVFKNSFDGPEFIGIEGFDFCFTLTDQLQGNRLNAPRRTCAGSFRQSTGEMPKPTR